MATKDSQWTREQRLLAFDLYCQTPFGKMHKTNPAIVQLAGQIGRTPSAVAMKLSNLASLDPAITSTGRSGLGSASKQDRAIWDEYHANWEKLAVESQKARDALPKSTRDQPQMTASLLDESPENYEGLNKRVLTSVRLKQSFFRGAILSSYQSRCCMSGITEPKLLVASHILPWGIDKSNRLNPRNGLCLSALHDRAFDQGLITVTPDYRVIVSKQLQKQRKNQFVIDGLLRIHGERITLPDKFWPSHEFLEWHNKNRFVDLRP
jgi:putative restriction endonuclease